MPMIYDTCNAYCVPALHPHSGFCTARALYSCMCVIIVVSLYPLLSACTRYEYEYAWGFIIFRRFDPEDFYLKNPLKFRFVETPGVTLSGEPGAGDARAEFFFHTCRPCHCLISFASDTKCDCFKANINLLTDTSTCIPIKLTPY